MERKVRYCAVCATAYKFCPRCNEDKDKPLYHYTFCSENCKDIYSVTSDFENGVISHKEAFDFISKLDLTKIQSFRDSYKSTIDKINKCIVIDDMTDSIKNTFTDDSVQVEENKFEDVIEENSSEEVENVLKKSKRAKKDVE